MATKSSIHIKPCNIASSEAHNRRTAEYMRNIGKSKIYIVPELTADNEQWINPDFGSLELQTHYENIKRMVKEKTGRAMQEKERERMEGLSKWRDVHPSVKEYCLSDRTPHWLMYADSVKSVKSVGASLHYKFSCTKTKDIG